MNKVLTIGIVIAVLVGVAVGGSMWFVKSNRVNKAPVSGNSNQSETNKMNAVILGEETTYKDDSGFSFRYLQKLTIKDTTPQDYYSQLEITSSDFKGNLEFTIKDTKSASLSAWLASDPQAPVGAQMVGATSLGSFQANQYAYQKDGKARLLTIALDSGILYMIDGPHDNDRWEDIQNKIAVSFQKGNTASNNSTFPDAIDDGEEIVE